MGVTNKGLAILMDRLVNGGTYSSPDSFKVGRGTTAFSPSDTDLEDPIPISGTETVDDCETADWTDSADMTSSLNTLIFKEGSAALNLTKDGTASAGASVNKTTTSLDFTDKELMIWLYIVDSAALAKLASTGAVTIRFGSDGSNYYEWTFDNSDLAVGWNLLQNMTSATASTTGSPTITACDYSYLLLTADAAATVWSAGDIVMDYWQLASEADFEGTFEVGYPEVNETNNEITWRASLLSTDANGFNVSEIGIFNSDTTPNMWSRDTFTPFSKSDTEELRFIIKDQFTAN